MLLVDRGNYIDRNPYIDKPQSIAHNATISAPHMHARALHLMRNNLYIGAKCLDIGSGSGYLLSCMKLMVGITGIAIGLEINIQLAKSSVRNIQKDQPKFIHDSGICLFTMDGGNGLASQAPYDAIHIGAAIATEPDKLVSQLKVGGVLVTPFRLSSGIQQMTVYYRENELQCTKYSLEEVRYVLLQ